MKFDNRVIAIFILVFISIIILYFHIKLRNSIFACISQNIYKRNHFKRMKKEMTSKILKRDLIKSTNFRKITGFFLLSEIIIMPNFIRLSFFLLLFFFLPIIGSSWTDLNSLFLRQKICLRWPHLLFVNILHQITRHYASSYEWIFWAAQTFNLTFKYFDFSSKFLIPFDQVNFLFLQKTLSTGKNTNLSSKTFKWNVMTISLQFLNPIFKIFQVHFHFLFNLYMRSNCLLCLLCLFL